MLRLDHVTLARGANRLLEDASLTVHVGHKVGIVGPNGCGKSTLFALLRGELHPESGDVAMPPRWTIAHVAQETPAVEAPAIEFVMDGDAELRAVERALRETEQDHAADGHAVDGHAIAELHHRLEAIDGYAARARAATLLAGLGFADARHADPVASFSGGWRMRLNLAQALMARSDLLLLDEPTNHLDLDAVMWLEEWLARYPGTLLLITHDRDFLDHVVDGIVHFDGQRLKSYAGNYSDFERERAGAARGAAGRLREAAAHDRAPEGVRRPLPRQGDQGQAGAEPPEGARADGGDRRRARRQPVLVRLRAGTRRRQAARPPRRGHAPLRRRAAGVRTARREPARRRPHRAPRPQRRRQVDARQGPRRHAAARRGPALHRPEPVGRLLRPAPAGAARSGREPAAAPRPDRSGRARAGVARLPRRLRLPRRHGHRGSRAHSREGRRRGSCWR